MDKYKKSIGIFFEETIGDLIYTSSIISSVRKNEPEAHIHVVTSDLGLQILNVDNPDYDVISKKFNELHSYDIIYYPLRCLQRVPYWFKHNMHLRDIAAHSIGLEVSVKKSNIVNKFNISDVCRKIENKRYIIINNRASRDRLKEVPLNIMNEALKEISKDCSIYQIGLSQDPPISSSKIDLLGETSILDSLYLIKNAYMVIGIDNYCLHAAGAYNTSYIGIYGQYDREQVKPIDESNNYEIINKGIFGNYNINGCNAVKVEEILNSYQNLRSRIDGN